MGTGAAGIALRHIHRARAGNGSWRTVQHWAVTMTGNPITTPPHASSLYTGAPAVAFALHSAGQPAYAAALETLDHHIAAATRQRLDRAHERIDRRCLPTLREFDLIGGLTGLGAYLLYRHGGGELLRDGLSYLVRLSKPIEVGGETLPGWWTGNGPADQRSAHWPGGHANFGIAHGIAGPLALLSTTMRRGIMVSGQADAISDLCTWLDRWRCGTNHRPWWPEMISLPEWRSGTVRQRGPHRPSWCYGTPGLARAQQLAAVAMADPARQRHAERALVACLTDEHQLAQLGDVSLCHGWAGLALTTWRAATDSDTDLAAHIPRVLGRLDQHLARHGLPPGDGLLEGTAGINLVRDTTTATTPPASTWDACLLISG
nr:lanthionine synthetase C family protein [Planosporangium thailandense]